MLAATTVGIGDFISNAVAGERYGMTFAWAIVLAVVLKYFLTEGLGGGTWRRARRSSTAGTLSDEG